MAIYIALLHYPVYDRQERVTATALTTLDIHDVARLARTYGLKGFYVVTPLQSQQTLARRLIDHWVTGRGAEYNPTRKEALSLVRMADNLEAVVTGIEQKEGREPRIVATTARRYAQSRSYGEMIGLLRRGGDTPYLILLGTGWGLTREVVEGADYVLEPIEGKGYNHLSVRTAAAIILDRLLGGVAR
ncbi:MAG: RNA methyltransferase [Deltaproteobacteria bacterium]|nr:RNA methyltransferase [Deltaproteobacteria bacterium]